MSTPSIEAASEAGKRFGYPLMLKNKRLAYDGKGNAVVQSEANLNDAYRKLAGITSDEQLTLDDADFDVYAEQMVSFTKELAVMVVRTINSDVLCYPVVETIQQDNICHLVTAPAQVAIVL